MADAADEPGTAGAGDPVLDDAVSELRLQNIEDLDLRDTDDAGEGQVIATWLGEESRPGEPGRGTQPLVRRAQSEAERAVEESAVPSRYAGIIRRYFGRLNETVNRAAGQAPARGEASSTSDKPESP